MSEHKNTLTPEQKLSGDMLMLTTGLMVFGSALWLAIYWSLGYRYSATVPLAFQVSSALTVALYHRHRAEIFVVIQLGLILFTPFAMQWSIGNFVTSSGVSLWALLAPIGALTVLGTRQSIPWFFGWLFMTILAGTFDYLLSGPNERVDARALSVFFVLNFTAISVMIYALIWSFVNQKQKLRALVDIAHDEVRVEKDRGDRLLLNVLPPAIAERLKAGEVNIAQGHADVTVMFADIVGFTRIAEELSPAATAGMLNDVFTRFDDLADAHGVEKIKTVGDAYMAAVGLEAGPLGQNPASAARMALGMMKAVHDYSMESERKIELRIGIATGPVVAGVIGRKKFIYDIWGDTVNIASRMASDAPAGAIQCDPATRWSLGERFAFDEGREVDVKGKGRMRVFRLLEDLPP